MSEYDFKSLTPAQEHALGNIAMGLGRGLYSPKTLNALKARGLIEEYEEIDQSGWPPVKVKRYSMPLPVHIAWCEFCSECVEDC